jgi:hypothetical protein
MNLVERGNSTVVSKSIHNHRAKLLNSNGLVTATQESNNVCQAFLWKQSGNRPMIEKWFKKREREKKR